MTLSNKEIQEGRLEMRRMALRHALEEYEDALLARDGSVETGINLANARTDLIDILMKLES